MPKRTTFPDYKYTSFSRLELYQKCQEFYKLKYIDRIKVPQPFSPALVVGSYVHEGLELVLEEGLNPKVAFDTLLPEWLTQFDLSFDPQEIYDLAERMGGLMYKATARYSGEDAIRNSNKSVPADVTKYPPGSWLKAMKESGIDQLKYAYDGLAARQNGIFETQSFTYLVGEIFSFLAPFKIPAWIKETVAVELPVSTDDANKVLFPGQPKLAFNAYMDWVFRRVDDL
jgi:hypothetical protein